MISSSKKINSEEFKKFFNKGERKISEFFRISIIKQKDKAKSKYSVILSKKKIKTAVLRNKNKRIIYEIISQIYPQFLNNKYTFILLNKDISKINKDLLKIDLIKILD